MTYIEVFKTLLSTIILGHYRRIPPLSSVAIYQLNLYAKMVKLNRIL